jgi:hypothetical protein
MTAFNILAPIQYLPSFFGGWILEIIHTVDNKVYKVIDYNSVAINTSTHARREASFQFYNLNNKDYFPSLVISDVLGY